MQAEVYMKRRSSLLTCLEGLRQVYDKLHFKHPEFLNSLPRDTQRKLLLLEREMQRLRNPDLTVAFVGGFSSGKSSLVNAFLGRYLLPESTEITTAVPTFVRGGAKRDTAVIHYLGAAEVDALDDLYRHEIAETFEMKELSNAPARELIDQVSTMAEEGRGKALVDHFKTFLECRKERHIPDRGLIEEKSIEEMHSIVRDEREAMFLDRVEVRLENTDLPSDVVLVDLPGVSVPNPRHRNVTFRFISKDAHAVVFVLMATRLFDKDEVEIMQTIRAGESQINEKTFWVLNRWDALSSQQKGATVVDFEAKMEEFAVPPNYTYFKTNALHGLLSQLCLKTSHVMDSKLAEHMRDYEDSLRVKYSGKHETAFRESEIPRLQEKVMEFLNGRLRMTTLRTAVANVQRNFCAPLLHHLRSAKERDERMVEGDLKNEEKNHVRELTNQQFEARIKELKDTFRALRERVAVARSTMFADEGQELEKALREEIDNGHQTDAYEVYKRIIADQPLRKYPYYFEIEMCVVDSLNSLLKQRFLEIVRSQMSSVVEDLVKDVRNVLDGIAADCHYNPKVSSALEALLIGLDGCFRDRVDGVVMERAMHLDELLLYKPKGFWVFGSGNEILEGLEKAARLHCERMLTPGKPVIKKDMDSKTQQIRGTLSQHYINQTRSFREHVAEAVWGIVIKIMHELEEQMIHTLNHRYMPALETVMSQKADEEFTEKKNTLKQRAKQFREAIDGIQEAEDEMTTALQGE